MMKLICSVITLTSLLFTNVSIASEFYFFDMPDGERITIGAAKGGEKNRITFIGSPRWSGEEVLEEFIKGMLGSRLYTLKVGDSNFAADGLCPAGNCSTPPPKAAEPSRFPGIHKIINGAIEGSNPGQVHALTKYMAKGAAMSNDNDLTYLKVKKHTGKPLAMCKITVSGCVKISEVIFKDDDNGFTANLPDPNSAWDDWEKHDRYTSINRAFADFMFSTRSVSCFSSYSKVEQADKKLVATCRISG